MAYQHLEVEVADRVGWLWLNRPDKRNALSEDLWSDIPAALAGLGDDPDVRVVVVAGRGPSFSVGIDLGMLASVGQIAGSSDAERNMAMLRKIEQLQATMSAFETCPTPVIAAIHGFCLGAGLDLVTACDMRLASRDAVFGLRETKMGLVADVGVLQRLPRILAPGHVAELAFTGDDVDAAEAERIGLVSRTFPDHDALIAGAADLAARIASNSPLVTQGIKRVLRSEEGMSTESALHHAALWNAAFLMSNDLGEAMAAHLERRPPDFTGT